MERSIRDFVSLMLFLVVVALWLNPAAKDANSDLLLETMVAKTPPQAANASSGGARANAPPTGSAPGTTIAPARRYRPSAASNGTVAGSMTAALQAWFAGARCGGVPLPGATRSERNVAPLWLDDAAPTAGERPFADDSALGAPPRSAPSDFSLYLRRVTKATPLRVAVFFVQRGHGRPRLDVEEALGSHFDRVYRVGTGGPQSFLLACTGTKATDAFSVPCAAHVLQLVAETAPVADFTLIDLSDRDFATLLPCHVANWLQNNRSSNGQLTAVFSGQRDVSPCGSVWPLFEEWKYTVGNAEFARWSTSDGTANAAAAREAYGTGRELHFLHVPGVAVPRFLELAPVFRTQNIDVAAASALFVDLLSLTATRQGFNVHRVVAPSAGRTSRGGWVELFKTTDCKSSRPGGQPGARLEDDGILGVTQRKKTAPSPPRRPGFPPWRYAAVTPDVPCAAGRTLRETKLWPRTPTIHLLLRKNDFLQKRRHVMEWAAAVSSLYRRSHIQTTQPNAFTKRWQPVNNFCDDTGSFSLCEQSLVRRRLYRSSGGFLYMHADAWVQRGFFEEIGSFSHVVHSAEHPMTNGVRNRSWEYSTQHWEWIFPEKWLSLKYGRAPDTMYSQWGRARQHLLHYFDAGDKVHGALLAATANITSLAKFGDIHFAPTRALDWVAAVLEFATPDPMQNEAVVAAANLVAGTMLGDAPPTRPFTYTGSCCHEPDTHGSAPAGHRFDLNDADMTRRITKRVTDSFLCTSDVAEGPRPMVQVAWEQRSIPAPGLVFASIGDKAGTRWLQLDGLGRMTSCQLRIVVPARSEAVRLYVANPLTRNVTVTVAVSSQATKQLALRLVFATTNVEAISVSLQCEWATPCVLQSSLEVVFTTGVTEATSEIEVNSQMRPLQLDENNDAFVLQTTNAAFSQLHMKFAENRISLRASPAAPVAVRPLPEAELRQYFD